jgi:inhibitor of cysteine peptidase
MNRTCRNMSRKLAQGATIALAIAATTLTGCATKQQAPSRTLSPMVQGSRASEAVSVTKGQVLAVRLPVETGTGYSWRMTPASQQNNLLSLQQKTTERADGPIQPGAQAWDVFTFKAQRSGEATLTFLYDRPFENGDVPSAKRFELSVMAE